MPWLSEFSAGEPPSIEIRCGTTGGAVETQIGPFCHEYSSFRWSSNRLSGMVMQLVVSVLVVVAIAVLFFGCCYDLRNNSK